MNPGIKLISTDFDGTVYTDFGNPPVPDALQELLARFQRAGVRWVVNTGRDLSGLLEAMARAHLRVLPDYLVVVEREIYERAGARYVSLDEWNVACARSQEALFARIRPRLPGLIDWINGRYSAVVYEDAYSPFCMIAESNIDSDRIVEHVRGYFRDEPELVVVRNDVYARFSHASFNKGSALGEIARRLGIPASQVVAAGDHWNDLPMLDRERAHHLIAPANAIDVVQETVRRQGGHVSPLLAGDGVMEGLQTYLPPDRPQPPPA
jgi:hypothetical protein